MEQHKTVEVSEFIVQADVMKVLFSYFDQKPYGEVNQIIALLRQSKPILPEEDKKEVRVKKEKDGKSS